jgi:hypothetical protein
MNASGMRTLALGFTTASAFFFAGACVQIGDGIIDDNNDGVVSDNEVMVVIRNRTADQAVDVEIHATDESLAVLPTDLFVDDFLITSGIGLAGTGILAPRAADFIELPCNDDTVIGTAGGAFLDNATGDETGRGVARWLEAAPLGLCGSIVTFSFDEDGGDFVTLVEISR